MSKKLAAIIVVIVMLTGIIYLVSYSTGFNKYLHLRKEIDSLNTVVKNLEQENHILQGNYDSLQNKVHYKIEKIAREKYNMKKPEETAISIDEK
jgi:cell division protein FtsB